jgi:hypothetical protein
MYLSQLKEILMQWKKYLINNVTFFKSNSITETNNKQL